jgi:predicted CoA-substrate-specific enzyme activase
MAVAGIDLGSQTTKVVILEADRILASVTLQTGTSAETEARQAMDEALRQAHLTLEDLKNVVATGTGRMSVPFARSQRSILTCLARGAHFLFPQARTVLDAGADRSMAIRLSTEGTAEHSAINNKCAAGAGIFLDTMSRRLRIPVAELGPESLKATQTEPLSSTCAVFAESEVVGLVHRKPPVPLPNILAGIHQSVANRLFALAQRAGIRSEVVMSGGVSRNSGIIRAMEAKLGRPVLVPDQPQLLAALGAALIAQEASAPC